MQNFEILESLRLNAVIFQIIAIVVASGILIANLSKDALESTIKSIIHPLTGLNHQIPRYKLESLHAYTSRDTLRQSLELIQNAMIPFAIFFTINIVADLLQYYYLFNDGPVFMISKFFDTIEDYVAVGVIVWAFFCALHLLKSLRNLNKARICIVFERSG